jgi:hypothetical protein
MAEKDNADEKIEVVSVSALTPSDKALIKFGEKILIGSGDAIKDFSKVMITLTSGLFATYFAVLKFLGFGESHNISAMITGLAIWPPLLLIASMVGFVFGVVPLSSEMALESPESIRAYRQRTLRYKYWAMSIGLVLFLTSMILMTIVSLALLYS